MNNFDDSFVKMNTITSKIGEEENNINRAEGKGNKYNINISHMAYNESSKQNESMNSSMMSFKELQA